MATPIIASAVTKVVQLAVSWKGKRDEIVNVYNNWYAAHPPYPRHYRVKYEDMLCATAVSALFLALGEKFAEIVPGECGAQQLFNNMNALDRAVIDRNRTPNVGDLIFFGPSNGRIQHVGIVTELGNNNKQIYYYDIQAVWGRHTCPVGYSWIKGYGMPDYASIDAVPSSSTPSTPAPSPVSDTVIKAGDLVRIKEGAKWYKGYTIPPSVMADEWFVIQNKNGRAVLGENIKHTRNIQSPIHDTDLIKLNGEAEEEQTKELTVTLKLSVYEALKQRVFEEGTTFADLISTLV